MCCGTGFSDNNEETRMKVTRSPTARLGISMLGLALVQNMLRDPFEQAVGEDQKTFMSFGG
jgi:hypothetical protein